MTTKQAPEGWVIVDMGGTAIPFCGSGRWFTPNSLDLVNLFPTHRAACEEIQKWVGAKERYEVHPWPIPRSVLVRISRNCYSDDVWSRVPTFDDVPSTPTEPAKGKTMAALQAAYKALIALADAAADDAFPFEKGAPKVMTPDEAQAVAKHVEAAKTLLHTIGGLVSYAKSKGVDGG